MKVSIESHSKLDKSFEVEINGEFITVDYDDVNHVRVDAVIDTMAEILSKHWKDKTFKQNFKKRLRKEWASSKELQNQFDFDEFCFEYGI